MRTTITILFLAFLFCRPCLLKADQAVTANWDKLKHYNVRWQTPSENSSGSMPIGNGDIGLNVWMEANGDLLFYIGKTDSWSENGRLLKLGKVRLSLTPNPFSNSESFEQILHLQGSKITITGLGTRIQVWVDANSPVVWVEIDSGIPLIARCGLELWRTCERELEGKEANHGIRALSRGQFKFIETPDTVVPGRAGQICWYHRNPSSIYPIVLKNQHLDSFLEGHADPLLHRTFGGCILGDGFKNTDPQTLVSESAEIRQVIEVHLLTAQTDTASQWIEQIDRQVSTTRKTSLGQARKAHLGWWRDFWDRSWIYIEGPDHAEDVTRGYILQRFINACGGRGQYPIKFNGSIFTVDAREENNDPEEREFFNCDYRRWGGNYWFQNTRLPYWAMLASGDTDLMQPLFGMYRNALPLAEFQTQTYFHHNGAFFPETMYFWGSYCNCDFGWNNPDSIAVNPYIRYYWSGGLELTTMLMDYFDMTGDEDFARTTLLPLADAITSFFDLHWGRGDNGKIHFSPSASLETWHTATDPLPEIAGLNFVLTRLLELPESLATPQQRQNWKRLLAELPPLPTRMDDGVKTLAPAVEYSDKSNIENPQLYAVFPYRLFGVGKADLQLAIDTFHHRGERYKQGWQHSSIQAALLGLADEAAEEVVYKFTHKHEGNRFPAFWGPNYDWIPDQCHGNVGMIALQRMLLQWDGDRMMLFPAWPKSWNVKFKLHGPNKTTVEASYLDGKIGAVNIQPEDQRHQFQIINPK